MLEFPTTSRFTSPQITELFVSDVVALLNTDIPKFQMKSFYFRVPRQRSYHALMSQCTFPIPSTATGNRSPTIPKSASRPKKALILQLDDTGVPPWRFK